jgi:two-component system NtrC family sensor kinase
MSQSHDDAADDLDDERMLARETSEYTLPRQSHVTPRQPTPADAARRDRFEPLVAHRAAAAVLGALEPPAADEVLFTVLELNRTVSVEMQDESIVHGYVEAMRSLFPRRRFAVRLLAPGGSELVLVYATGRLAENRREQLVLSADALDRHDLAPEEVEAAFARISESYEAIFAEPGAGFDIPLSAGGELAGVMSVEYEPGLAEPSFDRSLIVPLAVQLGAALRNARLLRESNYLRNNLEKLLDNANAPIVVIGRDRELRVVNRAFLGLTGASRDALLGRDFLTLLPETERGRILPVFIRALRGESTSNFEMRMPRSSGGHSRLVINTASILASDGEIEGVIAIGRDLTEQRELEEQIIQAEKLASLGQLAAGVVHELNNPLTSISVYGEYLLRKGQRAGQDPDDLEKLGRIVESADRILKFTRDLVTYARPSTEEPAFVRIRDVLDQSLLFCEHLVSDTHARVVKRFHDEDALVYAVKGQLHQVFINLITNACHALPRAEGELVLSAFADPDEMLHVTVEDNGCGIPETQREKIFEPFFSTKGEGKGTGLGLSIVRNILQQHGGSIEVKRREGGGTIFEIRLPGRTGG